MRRLPRALTVVAISTAGCSPQPAADAGQPDAGAADAGAPDAGLPDAGFADAGASDAGAIDAGPDDGGCRLPSDFPKDAGFLEQAACQCLFVPILHCFEENGPRCFSWACPPQKAPDGGYVYTADGGVVCLC